MADFLIRFCHIRPMMLGFRPGRNQHGGVAIVVALCMGLLLTLLSLVLDSGYLYSEKSRLENAVDASALAGVYDLDSGTPSVAAGYVAAANGLSQEATCFQVATGYYDTDNQYADFVPYKDFIAVDDPGYPDEFVNAVRVTYNQDTDGLTGLQGNRQVKAVSVAYLKRYGLISLDEAGEIQIGPDSAWQNGAVYAAGDIKLSNNGACSGGWFGGGASYQAPDFDDVTFYAGGRIFDCPIICGASGEATGVDWSTGSLSNHPNAMSETARISLRPCDKDYVDSLKSTADTVYTPNSAGQDAVFYGAGLSVGRERQYFFDLTRARTGREVIFFDAEPDKDAYPVCVAIIPAAATDSDTVIANVTFITNANVYIANNPVNSPQGRLHYGTPGDAQFILITAGSVNVLVNSVKISAMVVRCGGDFHFAWRTAAVTGDHGFRVIADKSIYTFGGTEDPDWDITPLSTLGRFSGSVDFAFGPPCPPTIARFGVVSEVQ